VFLQNNLVNGLHTVINSMLLNMVCIAGCVLLISWQLGLLNTVLGKSSYNTEL